MMFLALTVVALAGLFLFGLGLLALAWPAKARSFLLGFAETAAKHYLELCVRLAIGAAFIFAAPRMAGPAVAEFAGWVLVLTTALMFLVPWRMHRAFAQRSVPQALAQLPLLGFASLAGGTAILWSVYTGSAI
ncbi:MAG: hypothetical protein CFE43_14385 [Burkholderiales bacterium PBB3]|nr:MAG: hypothetical protein CFE43_14385 [Burkholderiales bacterium PBB3]